MADAADAKTSRQPDPPQLDDRADTRSDGAGEHVAAVVMQSRPGDRIVRGHHPSNLRFLPILYSALVMLALAVFLHVSLWFLSVWAAHNPGTPPTPLAARARGPQTPPSPTLQVNPPADIADVRHEEEGKLTGYAWVDPRAGIARIPIGRAMDLLVQHGLPKTPPVAAPSAPPTTPPSAAPTAGTALRGGAISPASPLPPKAGAVRNLETRSFEGGL